MNELEGAHSLKLCMSTLLSIDPIRREHPDLSLRMRPRYGFSVAVAPWLVVSKRKTTAIFSPSAGSEQAVLPAGTSNLRGRHTSGNGLPGKGTTAVP